mgnify:FL=1
MRDPTKMAAAFERGTHVFTVHRGGLPADITHIDRNIFRSRANSKALCAEIELIVSGGRKRFLASKNLIPIHLQQLVCGCLIQIQNTHKPQFAILRFAKYKGPEISNIEAHNERTKEEYASNPDIDKSRSHLNFHLLEPERKYRAEAERQIKDAGCRTRSDSVRLVEALVTATPEFFKGKKKAEIKTYFQEALDFIKEHQDPKTIISAVVHMDEKTPHMHLSFVPLTADGRLCAKEIVGNKKKLTQWQDRFWEHMVKKYPDLERGESASETGRDHIPPRVFKEMTRLTKQKAKLEELLSGVNAFNAKGKAAEIGVFLDKYIPAVEQMHTTLKKYNTAFTVTTAENKKLKKKTEQLEQSLDKATQESTLKKLADAKLHRDYEDAVAVLDRIPKEVLAAYTHRTEKERETAYGR